MVVTWKHEHFEHAVTADHFEGLCQKLLTRLRDPVKFANVVLLMIAPREGDSGLQAL